MGSDSLVRLLGSVAGVLGLVLAGVWLGDDFVASQTAPKPAELAIERDVDAELPPVVGASSEPDADTTLPVENFTMPASSDRWTIAVSDPVPEGRLVVLRADGRIQVVDFARGVVVEAPVDPAAEEIAVLGDRIVVRTAAPTADVLLVDIDLSDPAVALQGLPVDARPDRLISTDDGVQVWGRVDDGGVRWSGADVRLTETGFRVVRLRPLGPPVMPVDAGAVGLVADDVGSSLVIRNDRSLVEVGSGSPVALVGDRVVRLSCDWEGCSYRVAVPGQDDTSVIPAVVDGVIADVVHPGGVASPDRQRVAVTLQLRYDAGRRPAVLDLESERIELVPTVLPPDTPSDAYAWSRDGRWLFVPLDHQVLASATDRVRVLNLGEGAPIIDTAVG